MQKFKEEINKIRFRFMNRMKKFLFKSKLKWEYHKLLIKKTLEIFQIQAQINNL